VNPGAPPQVRSDRDKLSQILKNFLSNAVKFTDEGGVEIRVGAAGRSGCPLRIDVQDTGIGIPPEKHALVFEAFKQADGSTSRRYGGTGLGLSISRELALLLGGLIELASTPGEGSTFSLLLPLDPENPDARSLPSPPTGVRPAPPPIAVSVPHADLSGHCVLLVERDVSALLQITPLLERLGLKVLAAADREEALECLREEEPCSLVLLDTGMPEQDGCATIQGMRAEPRCAGLPIIAIDNGDDPAYAAQCRAAGVCEVLPRPLDPVRLETALVQHLKGTSPQDPHTAS
jgi:CheY-like chemotaxis protein